MQPRGKETSANIFVSSETRYPVVVVADYEGLEGECKGTHNLHPVDRVTLATPGRRLTLIMRR